MKRVIPILPVLAPPVAMSASKQRSTNLLTALPPLSLYVHIPWCVRKCPYCDFNSHEQAGHVPEDSYLEALAADLEQTLPLIWGRHIHTIFIGGGTPSLLSPMAMDRLLGMLRSYLNIWPDAEITLEANPGTVDTERFKAFADSGINRISLGIQSFNDNHLVALGRIHNSSQALKAIDIAGQHFKRVNLDLMFGLPDQTLAEAVADAKRALSFGTEHLSIYQLTIEPNTVFAKYPPSTPNDDALIEMEDEIQGLCASAGLFRYEVSAYAMPGAQAKHNLNYWEFGDYVGIGPGAHGKISFPDKIERFAKNRGPDSWMSLAIQRNGSHIAETRRLLAHELPFEFMLNALRLKDGVPAKLYTERTGQSLQDIGTVLELAMDKGLLKSSSGKLQATALGWRFLNDLQALFL